MNNWGITILNSLIVRFLLPLTPVAAALFAEKNNWGLFSFTEVPFALECIISILFLDFIIYWQHVLVHKIPLLWKLHRVHHTDMDLDVSSALRFHTLEIILSIFIKIGVVLIFGISALAILIFEIILNATAMFNHSNIRLPKKLDSFLRFFIVTPDMHRVHHSIIPKETDSNFGFNVPWWDYIFKSYKAQPEKGHKNMSIGLKEFQKKKDLSFWEIMVLPFKQA
ncbi:sterol desaturase family protein [Candidatus Peregrinibacteria bacterium]|nr:sterol desaturase family protein [Candidatus Peregrinibacteria bacterium]